MIDDAHILQQSDREAEIEKENKRLRDENKQIKNQTFILKQSIREQNLCICLSGTSTPLPERASGATVGTYEKMLSAQNSTRSEKEGGGFHNEAFESVIGIH